jgi:putative hydrolase of the HAD superfamily
VTPFFIFDLDNTLYPPEVPVWRAVDDRIELYVREKLGVDEHEARTIRKGYLGEFGTTLRGLMHHHNVSPGDYLEFVHDVPIPDLVPRRDDLGEMLAALPGRSAVFTNGSDAYARRVLSALGVLEAFDAIYGIEFMEYIAKPFPFAYAKLLREAGATGTQSLFCEDRLENLLPAIDLGMYTVWVGGCEGGSRAHAVVEDVCDLPRVLPAFLGNGRFRQGR